MGFSRKRILLKLRILTQNYVCSALRSAKLVNSLHCVNALVQVVGFYDSEHVFVSLWNEAQFVPLVRNDFLVRTEPLDGRSRLTNDRTLERGRLLALSHLRLDRHRELRSYSVLFFF